MICLKIFEGANSMIQSESFPNEEKEEDDQKLNIKYHQFT